MGGGRDYHRCRGPANDYSGRDANEKEQAQSTMGLAKSNAPLFTTLTETKDTLDE